MDLSPLEYAKLLTESNRRSKSLMSEEKILELIEELQFSFSDLSDKIARMYIEAQNKAIKKSKRKRKRKKKVKLRTPKQEIEFSEEEELKVKAIIDQWLDSFDREECFITHPVTLAVKADIELNIGVEKALIIIQKIKQECGLYGK